MKRIPGVLPKERDLRDYRLQKKALATNLPSEYEWEMPPVKDQKSIGSCVAHACALILEAHYGKTLSTDFIYGNGYNLYNVPGPGMRLRDACKIIQKYGDCSWVLCDTNTEVDEVYKIASNALKDEACLYSAAQNKITSYVSLNSIKEIKNAIVNYGPVLGAINWYEDNAVKDGVLIKGTLLEGGHAIAIIGYNEMGFIIQNSWGCRWGNKGKCVLPYNYKIEEAYGFTFGDTTQIKKPCKLLRWLYKLIWKNCTLNSKKSI